MRESKPASAAILSIVQQRAAVLLQEARVAAESIRQEAFDTGYLAGLEEGRRAAEEEVLLRYQAALEAVQQAQLLQEQQVRQWFVEMEPTFVDAVMDAAARVIKKQVESERGVAVLQARAALDSLGNAAWIRLRANPIDLPALEEARRSLHIRTDEFHIVADDDLEPGGVVAEGPGARIDATVEAQVENLRDALQRAS